jgi:hypothetical protein
MSEILNTTSNLIRYINENSNNNINLNIGDNISLDVIDNISNININNTFEISYTDDVKQINTINNASIRVLDRNDSLFKTLYIQDNDLYIVPKTVFNNTIETQPASKLLREDELETIINSESNPFIFSNIKIDDPGTIRFTRQGHPSTITDTEIGFRQNNGIIEFKNQSFTDWVSLENVFQDISFYDLISVEFSKSDAEVGDYIKLDSNKNLINTRFNIIEDTTPQLGGNLDTNSRYITFNTNTGILDSNNDNILIFLDSSSINNDNYLTVRKDRNSQDEDIIELKADSTTNNTAHFKISTKGSGDFEIDLTNSIDDTKGDIIIKANEFNLADIDTFNMSTGKFISSVSVVNISDTTAGLTELDAKIINTNTDTLVIENSNDTNDYYIYINKGINGQKLNIIYESTGINSKVILLFKDGNDARFIGTGGGLANQLEFTSAGQSACLQYLELYTSGPNINRNRWQILNTGCGVN